MLSFVFGGLGIVVGYIVIRIISLLKITTDNDIVQLLYGGDAFSPFLSPGDIFVAVFQLAVVTILAVIYPMLVARSITPLDAIARD
jgi:ABC-type lipoprotein release transport system permease subunit